MNLLKHSAARLSYIYLRAIVDTVVKVVTFYDLRLWYVIRRYGVNSPQHHRMLITPAAELAFRTIQMVSIEIHGVASTMGLDIGGLRVNVLYGALLMNKPLPSEMEAILPLIVEQLPEMNRRYAKLQALKILKATGEVTEWGFKYAIGGEESFESWLNH